MTALEEIKKALEGVTVQEWTFDGPANSIIIWCGEDTRVCFMTSDGPAKEHAKFITACNPAAISELLSTIESLQRENEALKRDRYDLAYAITGGEDAPGLLDTVPTTELVEIARATHRSHSADINRAEAAEAEVKRLRAALEPFARYAGDPTHIKQRAFLQLLICPLGDDHPDNHVPYFQAAKAALASTGGEDHAE